MPTWDLCSCMDPFNGHGTFLAAWDLPKGTWNLSIAIGPSNAYMEPCNSPMESSQWPYKPAKPAADISNPIHGDNDHEEDLEDNIRNNSRDKVSFPWVHGIFLPKHNTLSTAQNAIMAAKCFLAQHAHM
jgi:hypothetical protein